MEKLNYEINDKFIVDAIKPLSKEKARLLKQAISLNFIQEKNSKGDITLDYFTDYFEIYQSISNCIIKNLYDVFAYNDFPKASDFFRKYMNCENKGSNKDIIEYYLNKKINSINY